jgi:hypothetical protein
LAEAAVLPVRVFNMRVWRQISASPMQEVRNTKNEKCKNNAGKIGKGLLNSQQGGRAWALGEIAPKVKIWQAGLRHPKFYDTSSKSANRFRRWRSELA